MNVRRTAFVGVVITVVLFSAPVRAGDEQADTKQVRQVFEKYLASVKSADLALASQVWSQTPDVIAVTPFGRFQGWDSIKTDIYINFLQKSFSERNLESSNVTIHVNKDTAWLVFDWTFTAKLAAGQPITSKGWESHVYRRTPRGWALVALHYSVPPPVPPPQP
jgi:ketosteroid isomerase-like protein